MRQLLPLGDGREDFMRRAHLILLVILSLVYSSGCAVMVDLFTDPMGRKASLKRAQRDYTKFVRWGDVEGAARFVHPELKKEFLEYEDEFQGIRVTDFEVGEFTYGERQATALVRVTYTAYSMESMIEKEIKETQEWERLGGGNHWVVRPKLEGLVEQVAEMR
jgi:hypothetical protein